MKFIQFTDTQHMDINVQRYEAEEMSEIFNDEQQEVLSNGGMIMIGEHVEVVDLQAFYETNR